MTADCSLQARSLTLLLGPTMILDHVDFSVGPGWKVGLVGPNGVGKSTLLKVLCGQIEIDDGSISLMPPSSVVGYLPQEPERRIDETVTQYLARRIGVSGASAALDVATHELAAGAEGSEDRYADALDCWLGLGGADLDARIGVVCDELGIHARLLEQPMTSLSGGEAARAGLASLLLARFDLFLLDEPTNDLDTAGLHLLERWVLAQRAGLVVVSHDREFLRRTVTHVAELDEFSHDVSVYSGGWDSFLAERSVALRHARSRYVEFADRRSNLLGRAQREREWATQGLSKARRNPSDGDKHIKSFKINQTEQLAGKAARTERAFERLEAVEEPREAWQLRLVFGQSARSGAVVSRVDAAVVVNGDFVLGPISLTINSGERVAIVGQNGSGKSTLLRLLLGRDPLVAGGRFVGPSIVVGSLDQGRGQLSDDATLLDGFMRETAMTVPDARTLLAKFGLGAADVNRQTASLSPGERTRAVLALHMARGTNCLVLDEPTNHLDMAAIEQLEVAMESFAGTLLLVTHDRQLLANARLSRRIELFAGRVVADEPLASVSER